MPTANRSMGRRQSPIQRTPISVLSEVASTKTSISPTSGECSRLDVLCAGRKRRRVSYRPGHGPQRWPNIGLHSGTGKIHVLNHECALHSFICYILPYEYMRPSYPGYSELTQMHFCGQPLDLQPVSLTDSLPICTAMWQPCIYTICSPEISAFTVAA